MEVPRPIRELIVTLRNERKSIREIGKIVQKNPSTVHNIIKKYGNVISRPRSGRPPKLNSFHKRQILKSVREEPRTSAQKISQELSSGYV